MEKILLILQLLLMNHIIYDFEFAVDEQFEIDSFALLACFPVRMAGFIISIFCILLGFNDYDI